MFTILSKGYWVLDTKGVDGTLILGLSFIFLAYVLHPAVESAYKRARAHRAWRAIENNKAVEVTNYPMLQEIFVGRGNWDAPRMIAAMLALFSLASWGLELSMGFPDLQGPVYLLNRPPPVEVWEINGLSVWEVSRLSWNRARRALGIYLVCWALQSKTKPSSVHKSKSPREKRPSVLLIGVGPHEIPGSSFHRLTYFSCAIRAVSQVKSREDIDYDGEWKNLPNMFHDHAKSRYYIGHDGRHTGEVNGGLVVAYWRTKPNDNLFYYTGDGVTTVEGLQCADDVTSNTMDVYHGGVLWGTAIEYENGPKLTSDLLALHQDKSVPPPAILLKNAGEEMFLIVEESSTSPSFLYSMWTIQTEDGIATELQHEFHIAATMRLAEAVVTGIVQGERSGGACFGLLRKYSERRELYNITSNAERASPFGERPSRDSMANIQDIENISVGLTTNAIGLLCIVCIAVLTSIGIIWSVCVHSSVGMDVYDRDELVRAASANGAATGGIPPTASRIFVHREDEGGIGVVVNGPTHSWRGFVWAISSGLLALASLTSRDIEQAGDEVLHIDRAAILDRSPRLEVRNYDGVDARKVSRVSRLVKRLGSFKHPCRFPLSILVCPLLRLGSLSAHVCL